MIGVLLTYYGPEPKGLKRALPNAKKRGHLLAGNKWHRAFSRGHFKMSAMEKYGYRQRSAKYNKQKQASRHHQLPLVFSGVTRNRALQRDVRATSKKVDVVLRVQALNFGGFRQELTRVIASESRVLETTFVRGVDVALNRVRSGKQIKIK